MNNHEGKITHAEYVDMVVAVGGQKLEPAVERYTTTDAAPSLPANPYLFTDSSIESDLRLREGSGLLSSWSTPGGLIYITLEFANEGEETSSTIGLNTSFPAGWEIVAVGTRVPPGPVEHADYGYLNLPPGKNESYRIAARLSDNASLGNHTLQFTAMDLSGDESTFNTTVEVISEAEAEAMAESAEDEETEPTAPPASAIDIGLEPGVDTLSSAAGNGSIPVYPIEQSLNGTVTLSTGNDTVSEIRVDLNRSKVDWSPLDTASTSQFGVRISSPG